MREKDNVSRNTILEMREQKKHYKNKVIYKTDKGRNYRRTRDLSSDFSSDGCLCVYPSWGI